MARFLYSLDKKTRWSDTWPEKSDDLWVDMGPNDQGHIQEIVEHLYRAHPKVIEHLLHGENRRPSLLVEDDAVSFMLALVPTHQDEPLHHLSFIIGKHFLVTAHLDDDSPVVDQAFGYIKQNQMMDEGVDFALYQVLSGHVEALRHNVNVIDQQFERLHEMMLDHPYKDMAPLILKLRKRAMEAKYMLDPEGSIFELLKSSDFPYVRKKNHPYMQDVAYMMQEVVSEVEQIRSGLAEMVEAYTSLQSNAINLVMRFLTVISVLSLPATTIASIYGMNFKIPELKWSFGYWYALSLMLVVTLVLLYAMKKKSHRG
ncbi:magnesium transporter CorA family protein [Sulfobacillus harzensis]|uniref:Magnesium transporter CorA n=1 Tax=Sulfobacillus harzensis TaxID=2729629 RepID=A0A7Y0Q4F5_9FIRM|nr:CorA family divalent cation transporter [Sulfobacillus harzensis]NMP24572.1 magnesium transporter CorA [Sulfobacillus harzensis]